MDAVYTNYSKVLLESVDTGERSRQMLWNAQFGQERKLDDEELSQEFMLTDYAYASLATSFKAVVPSMLVSPARGYKTESALWNYTAVTRGEENLTIYY